MQTKVVVGLQLAGAGLVSRQWQRENVGIPDSEAMDEEIVSETIQDAVLQMLVQQITTPEAAGGAEQQAETYIEGANAPHPLLAMSPPTPPLPGGAPPAGGGGPPPGGPGGQGPGGLPIANFAGGQGQVMSRPLKLPPGAPVPTGEMMAGGAQGGAQGNLPSNLPQATPSNQAGGLVLDQVAQQFQGVQGLSGRVFLVGEIVAAGQTNDPVEVDITDSSDRDVISRQIQIPMKITVIHTDTPQEQYIEVTPGANPVQQGQQPGPEDLLQ
jgi:hypothetical protein